MFGRRNYVNDYNRLNPKCASVFHPMVDSIGGASSTSFFQDKEIRKQLDCNYQNGKEAIQINGDRIACENLHMQIVLGARRMAHNTSEVPAALYGMATTVPTIRSVVFGFGPGMAEALDADPYDVTLRTCFVIASMLGGPEDRSEMVEAARRLWQSFHDVCVEVHGKGDFYA